ncbi:hypothetical protein P7K49_018078 [Saguinus oedipus]|uniref:Uncharacterized protein n=1 Tax=Saguinus oedipus TaxID=9490 RepID=A0ABQ9V4D5_SAGOE|nr:hypothetical protein P7K49_018078 [Saguinus oedipus]
MKPVSRACWGLEERGCRDASSPGDPMLSRRAALGRRAALAALSVTVLWVGEVTLPPTGTRDGCEGAGSMADEGKTDTRCAPAVG